ncbi:MAG: LOG family protein [Anaerolineales bacterium]|nr:LOG family protein [Anaerolineales bacterium]
MRVTIFGGSKPKPGDQAYQDAYKLGCLLGDANHDVITGGYIGTMEAISRGAAESGAQVIGVTCDQIETWRSVKPNRWLTEEIRFASLVERMVALIDLCDLALVLPGGPGTLAEISLMWNLLIIGGIAPKPIYMIGDRWQSVFDQFLNCFNDYNPAEQRAWINFLPSIDDVIDQLKS